MAPALLEDLHYTIKKPGLSIATKLIISRSGNR
jgi:hypothetical protein